MCVLILASFPGLNLGYDLTFSHFYPRLANFMSLNAEVYLSLFHHHHHHHHIIIIIIIIKSEATLNAW